MTILHMTMHCAGCGKQPGQIREYVESAADFEMTPEEYIRCEDHTYDHARGSFWCTPCERLALSGG